MAKRAYSKADAVYGELKEAILSGALEPGRPIDKTGLCEKLAVSRFPVSAAVSRLAYDRLVDVAPQHGSFVSLISLSDVRERLFIRSALEGEIAAEAARRLTSAPLHCLASPGLPLRDHLHHTILARFRPCEFTERTAILDHHDTVTALDQLLKL